MKIKAYIIDLDNTIYSTGGNNRRVLEPVVSAVSNANDGALDQESLAQALEDIYWYPIWEIAEKYYFSKAMLDAGINAYENMEIDQELEIFSDFEAVKELKGLKFLVTSGIKSFQQKKIDSLGIADLFDKIYIDINRDKNKLGKKEIFAEILTDNQINPKEAIVIGDNPASEIKAGNELGMTTVLMERKGKQIVHDANFVVSSFFELKKLLG